MLVNQGLSRFKNLKVIQLTKQKQFRTSQAYNRLLNHQMLLLVLNSLYPPYWFQLLLPVMWPSGALLSVADMAAVQLECRERLHLPAVPNCFFKGAVLLNLGWVLAELSAHTFLHRDLLKWSALRSLFSNCRALPVALVMNTMMLYVNAALALVLAMEAALHLEQRRLLC